MHKTKGRDSLLIIGIGRFTSKGRPTGLSIRERNRIMAKVKNILDRKGYLGKGYWV